VNTIFYSVFFPSTCKGYSASSGGSNSTCLAQISSWSGRSTCEWHASNSECTINPPPNTLTFYATVAIIISLFIIFPSSVLSIIMEDICAKRPQLEDLGLDSRMYLGRPSDPSENGLPVSRHSDLGIAMLSSRTSSTESDNGLRLPNEDVQYVYSGALTIEEEIHQIVEDSRRFLYKCLVAFGTTWRESNVPGELISRKLAIMEELGMNEDGSFAPLSYWKKLIFGTPGRLLKWKLKRARKQTDAIIGAMTSVSAGEEDMRDRCLIQYFVLEQMSPIKRFAVRFE